MTTPTGTRAGSARTAATSASITSTSVVVVDEVAAAGPDEHLDADPGGQGEHRGDGADARRHPTDREVGAQLDPVGAGALGRDGAGHVVDAHLDEDAVAAAVVTPRSWHGGDRRSRR